MSSTRRFGIDTSLLIVPFELIRPDRSSFIMRQCSCAYDMHPLTALITKDQVTGVVSEDTYPDLGFSIFSDTIHGSLAEKTSLPSFPPKSPVAK